MNIYGWVKGLIIELEIYCLPLSSLLQFFCSLNFFLSHECLWTKLAFLKELKWPSNFLNITFDIQSQNSLKYIYIIYIYYTYINSDTSIFFNGILGPYQLAAVTDISQKLRGIQGHQKTRKHVTNYANWSNYFPKKLRRIIAWFF